MKKNYKNQNNPIIRLLLLLLLLGGVSLSGWGQTTIHYWSFNVDTNSELDASTNTPTSIPADIGNGVINHDLSFSTFGGSDLNLELGFDAGVALCPAGTVNNGKAFVVVLSTEGYENISFSFAAQSTASGYNNNTIEVSSDGGDNWELVVEELLLPSSFALFTYNLSAVDIGVEDNEEIKVRLTLDVSGGVSGGGNNRYDNIKITGDPLAPTASILSRPTHIDLSSETSESAVLIQLSNYTSDDVRYRLFSGENQYDLWDSESDAYISSSDYAVNPKVPGTPTDESVFWAIFQRGNNNSTSASYRDRLGPEYNTNNLTASLPDATLILNPHQIEDTDVNFSHNDYSDKHVVLAYDQNVDGTLISAASTSLITGDFSIVVPDDVIIRRIELRDTENILLESQTGFWTGVEAGWQITQVGHTYTIDFDNTVDGVNNGQFAGDGFNPEPAAGQLNSNAWAATGFRNTNMDFGDTRESDDYNRGTNVGTTGTAGIWAFQVGVNNHALGIKPGASTFTPGSITLRMQNQTGTTITSLSYSYIIYIYNNQDRGNTFNFSHSDDNDSYISVTELNLKSEADQDTGSGLEWRAYYRIGKITGINVEAGDFYYFRWNGGDADGSGSRDAFALDDITIVANPTEPLAVEGAFEELVLANTAEVAIAPNNNLTVNGEFVNNAGNSGLIIESDATGTGSLIHNSAGVAATVERYFATAETWRLVSSPVVNQVIIDTDNWTPSGGYDGGHGYDFYAWDEAGELWLNQKVGTNNITHFIPGKGYLVSFEDAPYIPEFIDDLNNGIVTIDVTRAPAGDFAGANLIGNPYASGIDWNLADRELFEDNFAYVYDRTSNVEGVTEGYLPIDGSLDDAFIAPHQGFFVIKDAAGSDVFTFTNAMRVHGGTFTKQQPMNEALVLRLLGETYYDQTTLRIHENSGFERDRQDARKFFSLNQLSPQVFSLTSDNVQVAINSVPEITDETVFPVGMRIPAAGEYTLSLQEMTGVFTTESIYLTDLKLNKELLLDANNPYTFTASPDDDPIRFKLHFSTMDDPTGIEDVDAPSVKLWYSNNTLYVNSQNESATVEVYDISGRRLQQFHAGAGEQSFRLNLANGVYIVRSTTHNSAQSMRIVVSE